MTSEELTIQKRVWKFSELNQILSLARKLESEARIRNLGNVEVGNHKFPIYAFIFGSEDKAKNTFAIFGGVHGLEKIGTHVATHFLRSLTRQMMWDQMISERLKNSRLVFVPLVNPGGMFLRRRSNPNGVDLMRNAPLDSPEKVAFMVGGHRYTNRLPWYRGPASGPMELESQVLIDFVQEELFPADVLQVLDLHSGFGIKDRLWYPYAKQRGGFPSIDEVRKVSRLLKHTYPYHVYKIEPQSKTYTTHGDLWDYLYDLHLEKYQGKKIFLPWTLEMGSWKWVRKNPRQIFNILGGFNPLLPHRKRRIMRRHAFLLDFFFRATSEWSAWNRTF